jgi:hypothetical protein
MRHGSAIRYILLDIAVVFCALFLVVVFVSVGAGLLSILALGASLLVFQVRSLTRRSSVPATTRRAWRWRATRAPPRF